MKRKWKSEVWDVNLSINSEIWDMNLSTNTGAKMWWHYIWCWNKVVLNSAGKEAETERWETTRSEISGTAKQNRRKSLALTGTIYAKVSLPFPHKNIRKAQERDRRDAKNRNLDDSQPEGKVRNLALIFLCENFPAVSTITVRVKTQ